MPHLRNNDNKQKNQRSFVQRITDKGLTLPGYNYLGPFNAKNNGPPTNPSDRTAQTHDDDYQKLQERGANPYRYYNQADEDADSRWGSDVGGRIAKRVFRIKKELAKRNIIGEIPPGRSQPTIQPSLRGTKRQRPEGFSRIQSASKRFRALIQDIDAHRESAPQVNSTATQQVAQAMSGAGSGGAGDGSGNQGGLKETPVDDVWNVTRGPPTYTFASLPFEYEGTVNTSRFLSDWVFRMTSAYDPHHQYLIGDINAGAGTSTVQVADSVDSTVVPARWFNYYSTT